MSKKEKHKNEIANLPFPMCLVNDAGKITETNEKLSDVFVYSELKNTDFFAITGIKMSEISPDKEAPTIKRNEKIFKVVAYPHSCGVTGIIFKDVTGFQELKSKFKSTQICVMRIEIDNYDDLISKAKPDVGLALATSIDKRIRKFSGEIDGSAERTNDTRYTVYFPAAYLESIETDKFYILDSVRTIETGSDFPLSLSIGVGVGGKTLPETVNFSEVALDLALGRGGDQAVVKENESIRYFGGKTQSVEKRNKGKSRIVGDAMKKLMEQSDRVFIMGHKNADMDAFGAAIGLYRLCQTVDTEAHIVLDKVGEPLKLLYKQIKATGEYNIIGSEKANEIAKKNDLLIIADTHRPGYVESPELLQKLERVVVIDHHRKAEDVIKNPTLAYIESYASSASELVTEMLQFSTDLKKLVKIEAEALLAGISLDTNRFAVKTGVRTFEAATWLRRSGADTAEVKRFFQIDRDVFSVRAKCVANVNFSEGDIATSVCEGENIDVQLINSQVADGLLNVAGVDVAFVAGKDKSGKTWISARSLGNVNVQRVMEKLGGGGHFNVAGAQIDMSPEDAIREAVEVTEALKE